MRYLFGLLLWLGSALAQAQSGTITFVQGNWTDLLAKAKKEHRNIFLYAGSPSCHFCVPMETQVFPDPAVSKYYSATFLSYKVNVDEGEGAVLAKRYDIKGLPSYLYFSPEGKLLHMSNGYKPSANFIQDGKDAFDPNKAFFTLQQRYKAGERKADFLYAYGTAPALREQAALYDQVNAAYLATQQPEALTSEKNLDYLFNLYTSFNAPTTQYFFTHSSSFVPRFGQVEVDKKIRGIVSQAANSVGRENNQSALTQLQQTISRTMPTTADQWNTLAHLQYLLGQESRDWSAYTDVVLTYGKKYAAQDNYTLYEATEYVRTFVDDKKLLAKADLIIQQALAADHSYLNLCTRAKLLHKLGTDKEALAVLNEAMVVAAKEQKSNSVAAKLLAEINK